MIGENIMTSLTGRELYILYAEVCGGENIRIRKWEDLSNQEMRIWDNFARSIITLNEDYFAEGEL